MHAPFIMNTQKSLQMVLTTLLLILAVYAMSWQERANRLPVADPRLTLQVRPAVEGAIYTDCCLHHALLAANGGIVYPKAFHIGEQRFGAGMLLKADSTRQVAASASSYKRISITD